MATDLSSKAEEICKQNYKTNCGKCELRQACIGLYGFNSDSHDKWVGEVNSLAERGK